MAFDYIHLLLIPLLIVVARIMDVSLATIRIVFISKGLKGIAPIIGFFEILIWVIVINQIMSNMDNPIYYIAYALGFASGTFIGMYIEDKLSVGNVIIRVIIQKDSDKLVEELKKLGYSLTFVDAEGRDGKVKMIFSIISRKEIKNVIKVIRKINPKVFYSIEDVRFVSEFKNKGKSKKFFTMYRKGK